MECNKQVRLKIDGLLLIYPGNIDNPHHRPQFQLYFIIIFISFNFHNGSCYMTGSIVKVEIIDYKNPLFI